MSLQRLYVRKWWISRWVLGLFFIAFKCNNDDLYFASDDLIRPLIDATSYITGQQKKVDDTGTIIGERAITQEPLKAQACLLVFLTRLSLYAQMIGHPIPKCILKKVKEALDGLQLPIANLPPGPQKDALTNVYNQAGQRLALVMGP